MPKPWTAGAGGVSLVVRLTPKGGRDVIEGVAQLADGQPVLKARVAVPPSEGAANDALVRLIARTLKVPPRDIAVTAGATARVKRLTIAGDRSAIISILEKMVTAR